MATPSTSARTSRTNISNSVPPLRSISGARDSGMCRGSVRRCDPGEFVLAERSHAKAILRRALRFERELFGESLENRGDAIPILQLENHLASDDERADLA